jgi:hypothetical protein
MGGKERASIVKESGCCRFRSGAREASSILDRSFATVHFRPGAFFGISGNDEEAETIKGIAALNAVPGQAARNLSIELTPVREHPR